MDFLVLRKKLGNFFSVHQQIFSEYLYAWLILRHSQLISSSSNVLWFCNAKCLNPMAPVAQGHITLVAVSLAFPKHQLSTLALGF